MEHPNLRVDRARPTEKCSSNAKSAWQMDTGPSECERASRDRVFTSSINLRRHTPLTTVVTPPRRKHLFGGLYDRPQEISSERTLPADYYAINLHTMTTPPAYASPTSPSSSSTPPSKKESNIMSSGYYLSDLLYRGRSNDEIFYVESQDDLRAKHGNKIRDSKLSLHETQRILEDPENFRRLQQMLRDKHCVTDAMLRENIHELLKESSRRSYQPFLKGPHAAVPASPKSVMELGEGRDEGAATLRNKEPSTRL